jgi:hypothetical protein
MLLGCLRPQQSHLQQRQLVVALDLLFPLALGGCPVLFSLQQLADQSSVRIGEKSWILQRCPGVEVKGEGLEISLHSRLGRLS